MSEKPDVQYLTLREFAERRGMRTDRVAMQRLRRRLKKKQSRVEEVFLLRLSEADNGAIVVTEPMMRHHCPELFDKRTEAIENLRKYVSGLSETIQEMKLKDNELAARIRGVKNELRELHEALNSCVNLRQSASPSAQG